MEIYEKISNSLKSVKEHCPLVHHITNYVTTNICADVTLAIGASPVMASAPIEVADMLKLSSALVLNIGTCTPESIKAMLIAGKTANENNIPIVLDPVGVGATPFRYESVMKLLDQLKITVIKGNLSEIKCIAGLNTKSRGVDSVDLDDHSPGIATKLATQLDCIIAITGKEDIISDGDHTYILDNGHILLTKITGTGCMTSSLIGSFLGANKNTLISAIAGISTMSIAGEIASKRMNKLDGSGSFKRYLMDAIYNMDSDTLTKEMNIQHV
ncbi:hydroxyethylthiazole kinase [Lutibacter sp. B2]|nr:hydroxyethylthiazole kinase [Lutibacter sp. B2]